MATGVLLVCVGWATRLSEYLVSGRKRYRARVRLGISTDTYDAEGQITDQCPVPAFSEEEIKTVLAAFRGEILQRPPIYSALKKDGEPLYKKARRGETVDVEPRSVIVYELQLQAWEPPFLVLDVLCSPGTYIRSLAHDLGQQLGTAAHLAELRRLASGRFRVEDAITLDQLAAAVEEGDWFRLLIPPDAALLDFAAVRLNGDAARRLSHGQPVPCPERPSTVMGRAYGPDGTLLAVVTYDPKAHLWRPRKVFA